MDQAPPDCPRLCINNCGFFGTAATMNLCSKCHKDALLQQEQAKMAAASLGNIVGGSATSNLKETAASSSAGAVNFKVSESGTNVEEKATGHPTRCSSCKKRVGLSGFTCRCGSVFCSLHRYSDKHDCPFDYRTAGREAISKANPIVKTDKLDKI